MNKVFADISEWFKTVLLSLNLKNHYLQFKTKNSQEISVNVSYGNKHRVSWSNYWRNIIMEKSRGSINA